MGIKRIRRALKNYTGLTRNLINKDINSFSGIIGDNDTVLDLGSGVDLPFKDLFSYEHYFGVDLYNPSDVQADIANIPIRSDHADLVICTEVLEHLSDPYRGLSEINRVLKSDCYLILTVPFLWGVHSTFDYYRWTEAGLRKLLKDFGFDVVVFMKRGGIFSTIGSLAWQIPYQITGGYSKGSNWILRLIFLACLPFATLIPWVLSPFDFLDRQKSFVLGYNLLCKKKAL